MKKKKKKKTAQYTFCFRFNVFKVSKIYFYLYVMKINLAKLFKTFFPCVIRGAALSAPIARHLFKFPLKTGDQKKKKEKKKKKRLLGVLSVYVII